MFKKIATGASVSLPESDHLAPPSLFTAVEWGRVTRATGISRRQEAVLRGVLDGRSDRAIANELHIALPTVRSHLQAMFGCLSVSDRTMLVLEVCRIALDRSREDPRWR
ncbi:Bacterial regulatory protein, luxR family [Pirellulimonas nuda]|uniref:Bacterial regulatory protein, luxR family n=1 Tax=Pirellulimonas nuda TaxID=2528009 RepID=A0A518DE42_9BACT|nr:LuxR C-terminal-related transcriptional regulator [Pirellulimonas nuda]QDU89741.1 Bacterial regulatory protein, luxR family [Pirellulimonas nuda]